MRLVLLLSALAFGSGCVDFHPASLADDGPRGGIGKADLYGSCAGSDCDGKAAGGNCWCDAECAAYGDCCDDAAGLCDRGLTFATFNAGLAHGAVPFAEERVGPIVDALRQDPADVLCLQEVWRDDDAAAIREGIEDLYPHAFRERTVSDSSDWFACGPTQWPELYRLNDCVSERCKPDGVSVFECVKDQCAAEYAAIDDGCKLCLAANPGSPLKCAAWKAPLFGQEGRNGLLLLSRQPLEGARYGAYETVLIKRGLISASVAGRNVQCTHLSADLDSVPYPPGTFASWREEQRAQVRTLAAQAGKGCTVLLGDLNAGPASPGVDAELEDNFAAILEAGYADRWRDAPVCTFCGENPLVCSDPARCGDHSPRIDHVLFRGCPDGEVRYRRIADGPISLAAPGAWRASDHYGVLATAP
jgi:endonuclease/exonuclease/phosphatase family metal-dependent hydrolase